MRRCSRASAGRATHTRMMTRRCSGRRCRRSTCRWCCGWKPIAWPRCASTSRRSRTSAKSSRKSAGCASTISRSDGCPRFSTTQFYTVSPYKHTTIGSMKDLDAASVEDVRDFHNQFYVPSNATIAIVGDFDMAQAKELVTQILRARAEVRSRHSAGVSAREAVEGRAPRYGERELAAAGGHRRVSDYLRRPPRFVSAAPDVEDSVRRRQLAHLSVARLREEHRAVRVRRRQHHRGAESVLRGRAGRARPDARRSREGARSPSSTSCAPSRFPSASCSAPRTSSSATTSSTANRFAARRASSRMPS